jgi:hypothetical protein
VHGVDRNSCGSSRPSQCRNLCIFEASNACQLETTMLTKDQYQEVLSYCPTTGNLRWKKRPLSHFKDQRSCNSWNARYANKKAGAEVLGSDGLPGSIRVVINYEFHSAHRIIWIIMVGSIPEGMGIDHINRNPYDNRLCNLRLATKSQNGCNRSAQSNNASGYKGVYWNPQCKKWQAEIRCGGQRKYLGQHETPELAYAAYRTAAPLLHGAFAPTDITAP